MKLHENRHINFFLKLLYALVAVCAGYIFLKYLLGWCIPLILAFLLSQLIIRPVNWLSRKTVVPRGVWSGLCTLLCVTLVGTLVYLIISRLVYETVGFFNGLPSMLAQLPKLTEGLKHTLDEFVAGLPAFLREAPIFRLELSDVIASIKLPQISASAVWSSLSWAVSSVPGALLTTVFIFVSTFFLTSQRTQIVTFLKRQMSPAMQVASKRIYDFIFSSLFGWLRAQSLLISITFCELSVGFFIMRQPYILLLALIIAIIDALPILGVGTVLIPWALISLFLGNFTKALTLCILYAVILIVRNSIEPRVLGAQIGLNPFVTLLCLYFGYRLAGFAGMFILPVSVLCIVKLKEWNYLHLWR